MIRQRRLRMDQIVQEASEESFPASDAPAWVMGNDGRGEARHLADNPRTLEDLLVGLNEDLAGELGTIIRYNYQAGRVHGIEGVQLRHMFREEITDELGHAAFLTDVIVDLGGEPTTSPMEFEKPISTRDMLEVDLEMERADVERYKAHAQLAGELGLIELKLKLEETAADESRHARRIDRILRGF